MLRGQARTRSIGPRYSIFKFRHFRRNARGLINGEPAPALLLGGVRARVLRKTGPLPVFRPVHQRSSHGNPVKVFHGLSVVFHPAEIMTLTGPRRVTPPRLVRNLMPPGMPREEKWPVEIGSTRQ